MINVVNAVLIFIWFLLIPFVLGLFAMQLFENNTNSRCIIAISFPVGFAIMLASFHLFALPALYFKLPFHTLKNQWLTIILVLVVASIAINGKKTLGILRKLSLKEIKSIDNVTRIILMCFVLLVLFETWLLVFHMHTDTDDVRFISEALEAYEMDSMLMYHPITGEYLGQAMGEMTKELSSPYPFFIATISKMIMLPPAITAHVLFPMFLIPLFFAVMYLIGSCFFENMKDIAIFLLLLSVLILFSFESVYALGYTLLTIIWQGRSILATIMLPLLWLFLMRGMNEKITIRLGLLIVVTSLACCNLSGMGIVSSICLMLFYAFAYLVSGRSLNKAVQLGLITIPAMINLVYYFIGYTTYGK